jgi:hypothetical protein
MNSGDDLIRCDVCKKNVHYTKMQKSVCMSCHSPAKIKFTNEDIAKALGYETITGYSVTQQLYGCLMWRPIERGNDDEWYDCPDFQNDLNAACKYVWPELRASITTGVTDICYASFGVLQSKNPALYLCEQFMNLKEAA